MTERISDIVPLLHTNQYNCGGESYLSNPDAVDRVIMTHVKEGNRKEYLLEYDESDIRLEFGIKVPVGAPQRSIDSLPVAGTQEETQKGTQKEVIGNIEYYLDCDVIPDRLIVYEWLFRVKIEDGLYYQQPWPDSQTTLDLTHGMPVTLSLKPERLYEIVAVWDGGNLEKNGFSGEAQYLLETKAVQAVN